MTVPTDSPPWLIGSWLIVVERPELVDEMLGRDDSHAGVALLALVLNHPDPLVVTARVSRGLASPSAQNRANALQSLGHHARLHGSIDARSVSRLRRALRDRTPLHGSELRGYAADAGDDIGTFVRRRELPRWLRRRFPGPRRPARLRLPASRRASGAASEQHERRGGG
ncbi:hypothetical protein ACN27G_36450 [Plantactinospora sp. WMMB334]|uniref:hypothetical protein n=1 Tax=Plantactinospora sp. WMMB334 TaxID=3404119 RepID=UPI003B94C3AD